SLSLLSCRAAATTDIYPLSLHDALPISFARLINALQSISHRLQRVNNALQSRQLIPLKKITRKDRPAHPARPAMKLPPKHPLRRSEEHTSELQSRENLVCRLLLEKKNKK